jgi:hypothetical protein
LEEYMEFIFVLGEAVGVPDCKVEGWWDYVSLDRTAVRAITSYDKDVLSVLRYCDTYKVVKQGLCLWTINKHQALTYFNTIKLNKIRNRNRNKG